MIVFPVLDAFRTLAYIQHRKHRELKS